MMFSLNEIEAHAKKAARGGGYAWGIAEETGKAVRWLASHGLPGAEVLAEHLELQGHDGPPQTLNGDWSSATGILCPLTAGVTLNDCADRLTSSHVQKMENVAHPLLVVPFVAWAALHVKASLTVAWGSVRATTNGYALHVDASEGDLSASKTAVLQCFVAQNDPSLTKPALRAKVSQDAWDKLNRFAQRTYAPATEASRLLGAGAGASDND
ncbi:MAG: DUF3726 domain-containing protein [Rhodobacteraceae bacterium]|nr:DUF3726 domain-containing protein [Paracoccaceae bacterium]